MRTFLFIITSLWALHGMASTAKKPLKAGRYTGIMKLDKESSLQFTLFISHIDNGKCLVEVQNAEEHIVAEEAFLTSDSLIVEMPVFQSSLLLRIVDNKSLEGVWHNRMKKDYQIPLFIEYGAPSKSKHDIDTGISGRWKVTFGPGSEHEYMAIGMFSLKEKEQLTGTFLTETGDYRFLSGGADGSDGAFLTCFDGSHAFLFKLRRSGDSLYGTFYSGKHWKDSWVAVRDDAGEFQLSDPENLTKVDESIPFQFTFPDLDSNLVSYPSQEFEDKVVIVQIMGSWCPNCMDETAFLSELHNTYSNRGLEIISVSFEIPEEFSGKVASAKRIVDHFDLSYPVLIGGPASKKIATERFPQLDKVISFPTSIFIDKQGNVRKVHTGFSGPGTGQIYEDFKASTISLIEEMLASE